MKRFVSISNLKAFVLLTSCFLVGGTAGAVVEVAASPTNGLSANSEDLLELLDGSALHGRLQTIDSEKGLTWDYAAAKGSIQFRPENIAWVRFPHPQKMASTNTDATCQFQFVNGDEFFGTLLSLSETELELQTWFGGKFKAPRSQVRSLRFFPIGTGTIYEGPTGLEGWQLGKNPVTQPWEYRDGAFIGNSPNSIGREVNLPDASRIEFDLSWNAPFNLLLSVYTGVFDGFNYNSGSYMFYITPGNISLQRISPGSGSATLGRSEAILSMLTKKKVHLEFRASKIENSIEVLADGKLVTQWKETAAWAGKGTGILFYTQTDGAGVKISDIKISQWDGIPSSQNQTNSPATEDQLYLVNRDKVSGQVKNLHDGQLALISESNSLDVPLRRVSKIVFKNVQANTGVRDPWEVQASVAGGGTLSFALEKWNTEKILGHNKTFGKITLNSSSIRHLEFNPERDKSKPENGRDDVLWEDHEK